MRPLGVCLMSAMTERRGVASGVVAGEWLGECSACTVSLKGSCSTTRWRMRAKFWFRRTAALALAQAEGRCAWVGGGDAVLVSSANRIVRCEPVSGDAGLEEERADRAGFKLPSRVLARDSVSSSISFGFPAGASVSDVDTSASAEGHGSVLRGELMPEKKLPKKEKKTKRKKKTTKKTKKFGGLATATEQCRRNEPTHYNKKQKKYNILVFRWS